MDGVQILLKTCTGVGGTIRCMGSTTLQGIPPAFRKGPRAGAPVQKIDINEPTVERRHRDP